jgi:hypothetical protein
MEGEYWRARVDRAIATRLLVTDALQHLQRQSLELARYQLTLKVRSLDPADAPEVRSVGRQVVEYYRAYGRLLNRARRLREHVARYATNPLHQRA